MEKRCYGYAFGLSTESDRSPGAMESRRRCCAGGISAARLSAKQVAAGQEDPWDRCRLLKFCAALRKSAARRMSKTCYRGGPKVRNSGRKSPEAKRIVPPDVGNSKTSPLGEISGTPASATKRLPELSKARPRGVVRPVANGLFTPVGLK